MIFPISSLYKDNTMQVINEYKPNLTMKKPNERQKVAMLEEVVMKGTLDDLRAVLSTYTPFEMTARALALASRYRGVDFVRELVEHGASFIYKPDSILQGKYKMYERTNSGCFFTEYYLSVVPTSLMYNIDNYIFVKSFVEEPLLGITHIDGICAMEEITLSLEDRLEVVKYISGNKELGVSLEEMLFWALIMGEIEFADALIEMGVTLNTTSPSYYEFNGYVSIDNFIDDQFIDECREKSSWTYLDIITSGSSSVYWNAYFTNLVKLNSDQLLPVLERLNALTKADNKKLILNQKMYESLKWNEESLAFAFDNMNISKINQKKAMEVAVSKNAIFAIRKMAEIGWLSKTNKRDALIEFARMSGRDEALAWLLDYKNRTADFAAEEAKAEKKMLRELTESPDSVSALKKVWGTKKLQDGTLAITNYKGSDTEIIVPTQIGKDHISVIGKEAFSCNTSRSVSNISTRANITSIVIPEGIISIGYQAFDGCKSLVSVKLPSTLKYIDYHAFADCENLTNVEISKDIESINLFAFNGCEKLYNDNFLVINSILICYRDEENDVVKIPEGVTHISMAFYDEYIRKVILPNTIEKIGPSAFQRSALESLDLPTSVKSIGENAFANCYQLKEIHLNYGLVTIDAYAFEGVPVRNIIIPETVTTLGAHVFDYCNELRDISVPNSVKNFGEDCFGWNGKDIIIHTTEDADVVEFVKKNCPEAVVLFDYGYEDYR